MRAVQILLLVLIVLSPLAAHSQTAAQYGIMAGWSRTDWDYETPYTSGDLFEPKNGFQAGLFLDSRLSELFGLRLELMYARKGAKNKAQAVDENGENLGEITLYFNADYIQIPLLFTLDFSARPGSVRPRLCIGPYLAGKVSSKSKVDGIPSNPNIQDGEYDLEVESADVGLVFAFGVDFDLSGHPLMVQARYDLGLAEVYYESKNQALTLMAGYGF